MQAIVTKYRGPSSRRGSRIVATAAAGHVSVAYDSSLSTQENHAAAAKALVDKYEWTGGWIAGGHPSGDGYVFVAVDRPDCSFMAENRT